LVTCDVFLSSEAEVKEICDSQLSCSVRNQELVTLEPMQIATPKLLDQIKTLALEIGLHILSIISQLSQKLDPAHLKLG